MLVRLAGASFPSSALPLGSGSSSGSGLEPEPGAVLGLGGAPGGGPSPPWGAPKLALPIPVFIVLCRFIKADFDIPTKEG